MTPILARSDGPHIKILAAINLTSICHILKSRVMQIWKTYSLYHMSLIWLPYMSLILVWYVIGILQYLLPLICAEYVAYLSHLWRKYWLHIAFDHICPTWLGIAIPGSLPNPGISGFKLQIPGSRDWTTCKIIDVNGTNHTTIRTLHRFFTRLRIVLTILLLLTDKITVVNAILCHLLSSSANLRYA